MGRPVQVFPVLPPRGDRERRSARGQWDDVLAEVAARPGVWVTVEELPTSSRARNRANYLRHRDNGPGRWEFASRTLYDGDKRHIVLAKFEEE